MMKQNISSIGVHVTPMTAVELVWQVVHEVPAQPTLLLNHNLHSVFHYHRTPWFRQLYDEAEIVIIDGWPVLKLLNFRRASRFNADYRIGSTDWLATLIDTPTDAVYRVFVLGGTAPVNTRVCEILSSGAAHIEAAGHDGYFDDAGATRILRKIQAFNPHLLLIGMGMPRQEQFIRDHLARLPKSYIATVGGALDYLAGAQRLAPRVLGKLGLEWLWRFTNEPGRLWRRYFLEPFHLAGLVVINRARQSGAWEKRTTSGNG